MVFPLSGPTRASGRGRGLPHLPAPNGRLGGCCSSGYCDSVQKPSLPVQRVFGQCQTTSTSGSTSLVKPGMGVCRGRLVCRPQSGQFAGRSRLASDRGYRCLGLSMNSRWHGFRRSFPPVVIAAGHAASYRWARMPRHSIQCASSKRSQASSRPARRRNSTRSRCPWASPTICPPLPSWGELASDGSDRTSTWLPFPPPGVRVPMPRCGRSMKVVLALRGETRTNGRPGPVDELK